MAIEIKTAEDWNALNADGLTLEDYRKWLGSLFHDWDENGRIGTESKRDVSRVLDSVNRALGYQSAIPEIQLKVSVADVMKGKPPGAIDASSTVKALWGWCLNSLPGNRYRKLLTRAIVKDSEYPKLTARIKTVWSAN